MKNSDMKVIAIILSIALFFTIVTSNAVSIASVVMLVKDTTAVANGTGDAATNNDGGAGDAATNNDGGSSNAVVDNGGSSDSSSSSSSSDSSSSSSSSDSSSSSSSSDSSSSNSGSSNSGSSNSGSSNSGSSNSGSSNSGSSNSGAANNDAAADNNPIMKDPFAAFSKAANDIHTKGIAGYNKISWQSPKKIEGLGILDSVIVPILEGFMTTEDEASVQESAKGSEDAKHRMPASNCNKKYIKSATAKKDGSNYVVTIVMVDFTNPSYADPDGLHVMTRDFLDYKDVEKEAKNIAIVKSLEGQIVYKDFTITAVMTADGKFVSITHCGIGYITAKLNGSINATGELEFNTKFTDFKY